MSASSRRDESEKDAIEVWGRDIYEGVEGEEETTKSVPPALGTRTYWA